MLDEFDDYSGTGYTNKIVLRNTVVRVKCNYGRRRKEQEATSVSWIWLPFWGREAGLVVKGTQHQGLELFTGWVWVHFFSETWRFRWEGKQEFGVADHVLPLGRWSEMGHSASFTSCTTTTSLDSGTGMPWFNTALLVMGRHSSNFSNGFECGGFFCVILAEAAGLLQVPHQPELPRRF